MSEREARPSGGAANQRLPRPTHDPGLANGCLEDDAWLSAIVRASLGAEAVPTGPFWRPAHEAHSHNLVLTAQSCTSRQVFSEINHEEAQCCDSSVDCTCSSCTGTTATMMVYEDAPAVSGPIAQHLTRKHFHAVAALPRQPSTNCTIVWCKRSRVMVDPLPPTWRLSEFRGEEWLTHKDLLARLIQMTAGCVPWYSQAFVICSAPAETGSLRSQHAAFVGTYAKNPGAVWIVKPCRGRRSQGITISDDLGILLRACCTDRTEPGGQLPENSFVICRYLLHPCLFDGRKFDLRFMVTLKNSKRDGTYVLGVYEKWIVRCADHSYTDDEFTNKRKHLTVMQYMDSEEPTGIKSGAARKYVTRQRLCEDLCAQHGLDVGSVSAVTAACCGVILECFTLALSGTTGEADEVVGITPNQHGLQCGALYGLDIMLCPPASPHCGPLQAFLLEVNPRPDTRRALDENPRFYDEVFDMLFTATGQSGNTTPLGWRMFETAQSKLS